MQFSPFFHAVRIAALRQPAITIGAVLSFFFAVMAFSAVSPALVLAAGAKTPAPSTRAAAPPLEVMAGQMIMCGFRGTGEEPVGQELQGLIDDIRKGHVGGVILFERDYLTKEPGRNIVSLEQVKRLTAMLQEAAPIPLFVGVDQEGGRVRRFKEEHGVPNTPSPQEMGTSSVQATYDEAFRLGKKLRQAGVNIDFAPSLDVNVNPDSPAIGALGRSFSADPKQVAAHGEAFARGLTNAGVLACYKHFPGHGSAAEDTHAGMADITRTWQPSELAPYKALLRATPPAMVMIGHMVHRDMNPNLPASLSPKIINGLLRKKLGWRGVVITDDLQMQAIGSHYTTKEALRLAVLAGVDVLLLGNNLQYDPVEARNVHAVLMELVHEGSIPPKRIQESYKRIMALKARMAGVQ